jgi:uncharacterized OB-fold protein
VAGSNPTGEYWPYPYAHEYTYPRQNYWISTVPQNVTRLGWECPKCNHVYSPDVTVCPDCPKKSFMVSSNMMTLENKNVN